VQIDMDQARSLGVQIIRGEVTSVRKNGFILEVSSDAETYTGTHVVVSTGGRENISEIENIHKFFAKTIVTCIDCDGYHFTGKKTIIIGNSITSANPAMGMQDMYSKDITLVLWTDKLPDSYREELRDEGIAYVVGRPKRLLGGDTVEAVEMTGGTVIPCEMVMSHVGFKLNYPFLDGAHDNENTGSMQLPDLW